MSKSDDIYLLGRHGQQYCRLIQLKSRFEAVKQLSSTKALLNFSNPNEKLQTVDLSLNKKEKELTALNILDFPSLVFCTVHSIVAK